MEQHVFAGTLEAASFDVGAASDTEPIGGGYRFQVGTLQMIGGIAPITNNAGGSVSREREFAMGTGRSF